MRYVRISNPDSYDEDFRGCVGRLTEEHKRYLIVKVAHPKMGTGREHELRLKPDACEEISETEYFKIKLQYGSNYP